MTNPDDSMARSYEQTGTDYKAMLAELQERLQQQQAQIEALMAEIEAYDRELPAPDALQDEDACIDFTCRNFRAIGSFSGVPFPPNTLSIGFRTIRGSEFQRGVMGMANSGAASDIGVLGTSTTIFGSPGDGTGVFGLSGQGTGVRGNSNTGPGVQGNSDIGAGVQGNSDIGFGVEGRSASVSGVFGFGRIGVQGVSNFIGVLGGNSIGPTANPLAFIGVAGEGPNVPDDFTYSYGGWFGRGPGVQGGTAPLHLEPANASDPNPPASAQRGDLFVDNGGQLWFCTDTGNPATWRRVQLV